MIQFTHVYAGRPAFIKRFNPVVRVTLLGVWLVLKRYNKS